MQQPSQEDPEASELDRLQTQWRQIREQFAAPDESLDELTAATLIQQWLATAHKEEFQAYEQQIGREQMGQGREEKEGQGHERQGGNSLQQVVQKAIAADKESNYLITQRYTFQRANALTNQIREKCRKIIQAIPPIVEATVPTGEVVLEGKSSSKQELRPVASSQTKESPGSTDEPSNTEEPSSKEKPLQSSQPGKAGSPQHGKPGKAGSPQHGKAGISKQLPTIRRQHGKVYNPEQMTPYFHLHQQSLEAYSPRSPHMFASPNSKGNSGNSPQSSLGNKPSSVLGNKYLKMAFLRFCRQSYRQRGTFSEVSSEGDKMNLNKWMIFCKEFDFNGKFHSKDLIEVYQQGTGFTSTMDLPQFLAAVVLLQQKYIDKFHTGQHFVEDVLKINSEAALQIKMQNLKVQYGGPSKNFLDAIKYTEAEKRAEIEKEKEYKSKKKEREVVLIKGMYEEHLKAEVLKLKQQREQLRLKQGEQLRRTRNPMLINRSMEDKSSRYPQDKSQASPSLALSSPVQEYKLNSANYSKMFHIKQHQSARKTSNMARSRASNTSQMYQTETIPGRKEEILGHQGHKGRERKELATQKGPKGPQPSSYEEGRLAQSESPSTWLTQGDHPSAWLSRIRSDSQESDQILKEHLELERKIEDTRSHRQSSSWMQEMQLQSRRVDSIRRHIQDEESGHIQVEEADHMQEDEMAETGVPFPRPFPSRKEVFS